MFGPRVRLAVPSMTQTPRLARFDAPIRVDASRCVTQHAPSIDQQLPALAQLPMLGAVIADPFPIGPHRLAHRSRHQVSTPIRAHRVMLRRVPGPGPLGVARMAPGHHPRWPVFPGRERRHQLPKATARTTPHDRSNRHRRIVKRNAPGPGWSLTGREGENCSS